MDKMLTRSRWLRSVAVLLVIGAALTSLGDSGQAAERGTKLL